MPMFKPRAENYPHRQLDCEMALEDALLGVVEEAQQHGWKRTESFFAIEELIRNFRNAYDKDRDPADDPIPTDDDAANAIWSNDTTIHDARSRCYG